MVADHNKEVDLQFRFPIFKQTMTCSIIIFLLCHIWCISAFGHHRFPTRNDDGINQESGYQYQTHYFNTQVDQFSWANSDTFKLRYLVADQWWDPDGGPIFFYTGNEGDIAWFCNNTGFMWDIAPEFKAMLVFAEHRYYGKSLPYGKDALKNPSTSGYLSSEQALADFAELLTFLKSSRAGARNSPVVAFGGSYGGMLAAWFRIKYPHIVVGSLAASAPIWQFQGMTPCNVFDNIVTRDYARFGSCADNIRKSWSVLDSFGSTESGRDYLRKTFNLCGAIKGSEVLKGWLQSVFVNLAMVDYPYPANFLAPLPGWPIKKVCESLTQPGLTGKELMASLSKGISVYYNYTGEATCLNLTQSSTSDLGNSGWDYQSCTEMVMPMCSDGKEDMFEPSPWNYNNTVKGCQKTYKVTPRQNWIATQYGGKEITAASNIIFSNGDLDPWSGGGVLSSLSDTLIAIPIKDGAHHLDLRASNKDDPPSVIQARKQEISIIRKWIKQAYRKLL